MAGLGSGATWTQVREHRASLAVSYGGAVVLNALSLLYPLAIGLAVDGLLVGSWAGVMVFAGLAVLHSALGVAKGWYSTRSFRRLYIEVTTSLVDRQRAAGVGTAELAARAVLVDELIAFLADGVEAAIAVAFAVVGSLAMLVILDPVLGIAAGVVAVPVVLINVRLARRSESIYRRLNDEAEREVQVLAAGSPGDVRRHFALIGRHGSRLGYAEIASSGLTDLIMLGLAVFAVVRATNTAPDVGAIFATLAYVWSYTGGLDQVPSIAGRVSGLADVRRRLDHGPEAGAGGRWQPARSRSRGG